MKRRRLLVAGLCVAALAAVPGGLYTAGLLRQLGRGAPVEFLKVIPCEQLRYNITSWLGESGTVQVDVSPLLTLEDGSKVYRVTYSLRTVPAVAAIYVLTGQASTLVDARTLLPLEYEEKMLSGLGIKGGKPEHEKLVYDRAKNTVTYYKEPAKQPGTMKLKSARPIPPDSHHFASLIYFIRYARIEPGRELKTVVSDRKSDVAVVTSVLRKEEYQAPGGDKRKALVLQASSDFGKEQMTGMVFTVWLDEADRYPVRIDAKTKWGTISARLAERAILNPSSETDESSGNNTGKVSVDPAPREAPP